MKARILLVAAGVTCAAVLILAAQDPAVTTHRAWAAPADRANLVNPLADRPETAAGGGKLFLQRCSQCHDAEGGGSRHAPSLVARGVQSQSDGELFWKISSGNTRRCMPSFSFLPELQRWQLVLHLRAIGAGHRPPTSPR
jgi:mono/diheme cytochrome c family protein